MMHSKKILYFTLSLACFLLAFLLSMIALRGRDEALAAHLAPQVLRFHVLANSDSGEDQALKIEVKSLLLGYLEDSLPADASLEETKHYIGEHLGELEQTAERYMREKGFSYSADARLTRLFPDEDLRGSGVSQRGIRSPARISGKGRRAELVVCTLSGLMLHGAGAGGGASAVEGASAGCGLRGGLPETGK